MVLHSKTLREALQGYDTHPFLNDYHTKLSGATLATVRLRLLFVDPALNRGSSTTQARLIYSMHPKP